MTNANAALERRVLWLVALIQFIDIWDFMIVMPLGPDFGRALGIDIGHLGWIAGSYAVAASITGLTCARMLDRLDRKRALLLCLGGLSVSTGLAAVANDFISLLIVRSLAGAFGGPLIAVSYAVIADIFPESRRGEAMGKVMGSFAVAAVLGVPLGLEIAHFGGWWAPFVAVALSGFATMAAVQLLLPGMRGHLTQRVSAHKARMREFVSTTTSKLALLMIGCTTMAAFMIIPNISAHVQLNMHYPREHLSLLYACGGVASFITMRLGGKAADRVGFARTAGVATAVLVVMVFIGFVAMSPHVSVLVVFIMFMATMAVRNITTNAIMTKIPAPEHRAGFMSLVSAIQHLMVGVGAFVASMILRERDGRLEGIELVAMIAIALFCVLPVLMHVIEKQLRGRVRAQPLVPPLTEEGGCGL